MRSGLIAFCVFVSCTASGAETTKTHGTQLTHPDGAGWQIARPTGAGFTALLPCPYEDTSVEGGSPVLSSRFVACRQPAVMWSAMQMEYASPDIAASWFQQIIQKSGGHELDKLPAGLKGHRTLEFGSHAVDLVGLTRATLDGSRIVLQTAEWRPAQEAAVKGNLPKFFGAINLDQ